MKINPQSDYHDPRVYAYISTYQNSTIYNNASVALSNNPSVDFSIKSIGQIFSIYFHLFT